MVKTMHSKRGAETSAKQCEKKQRFFRNPPGISFCFLLVQKHGEKADQVDKNKIDDQKVHFLNQNPNSSPIKMTLMRFGMLERLVITI